MAARRQRLSQRHKAAGLAQGSLAHGLRVERSTAARWETADTQPLPSIRLGVAVGRSSRVPVVAQPVSAEFDHPVVVDADPEAAIALPPGPPELLADDHPADINIADAAMRPCEPTPILVGGGFAGFRVPLSVQTDVSDLSSVTTMPLNLRLTDVQRRPDRSQPFKRFAAAGLLALVGSAASMSLLTSNNGPIPPATVGNPAPAAPVAAIPAPDPGSSNEFAGAPAAAPNKPADASAASVSTPHAARSTNRSKPAASKMTSPRPHTPAIPAEAYAWSQMAELSGSDQSRHAFGQNFHRDHDEMPVSDRSGRIADSDNSVASDAKHG